MKIKIEISGTLKLDRIADEDMQRAILKLSCCDLLRINMDRLRGLARTV